MNLKALLLTCLCMPIIASETLSPAVIDLLANQKPIAVSHSDAKRIKTQVASLKPLFPALLLASAQYSEQDWAIVKANWNNLLIAPIQNHIALLKVSTVSQEQVTVEKSRLELLKLYMPFVNRTMPHWLLENQASTTPVQHPKLAELSAKVAEIYIKPFADLIPEYESAIRSAEYRLYLKTQLNLLDID